MKQENINIQSVKIQSLRQAYVELGQCGSIVLQLPFSISKSYNLMRVTRPSGIYYILSFEEVHTGETVNDIKVWLETIFSFSWNLCEQSQINPN